MVFSFAIALVQKSILYFTPRRIEKPGTAGIEEQECELREKAERKDREKKAEEQKTEGQKQEIECGKDGEEAMWCVLHVKDGSEERAEAFLKELLAEKFRARCFHLTRSRRKKYGGKWQTVQEKLFPGYVFIDTDRPEAVYRELERVPGQRLLFSCREYVHALTPREEAFLERITDRDGGIGLSGVSVTQGKIRCLWGPLGNVDGLVKGVDLHGRTAQVEAELFGEKHLLYLGIEIVGEEIKLSAENKKE